MSRRTTFASKSSRSLFTAAIGLTGVAVALAPRSAGAQAAPPTLAAPPALSNASTAPSIADWDEHQPIPSGYREETRVRTELVVGGAVFFGLVYVPTSILSIFLASNVPGAHPDSDVKVDHGTPAFALGAIPIAGPFVIAAEDRGDSGGTALFVMDGVAQAAGMGMLVAGLAARRHLLARDEVSTPHGVPVPMAFGKNSAGLGIVGTF